MVTYDQNARALLIEFADPSSPHLLGTPVLGMTPSRLYDTLAAMSLEATVAEDVVLVPAWRVSFYAPDGVVAGLLLGEWPPVNGFFYTRWLSGYSLGRETGVCVRVRWPRVASLGAVGPGPTLRGEATHHDAKASA